MHTSSKGHKKTYYDAYKRARGVTYNDLKQQKLLTDRGAYMTFLEEKVTRLTASLLTVQGFDERIESFQTQMNLMEDKLLNINRTVRRNTRDINNNNSGIGGLNTTTTANHNNNTTLNKSGTMMNRSIIDHQVNQQQLNERLEIMEDMYLKVEKHIVSINNTLTQQNNRNNETTKNFEKMQKNMEEHIIRMENQWELKFDTYKKELQRISDDNLRIFKQTMNEYKNDLNKQNKIELDKYKYDMTTKQNDVLDKVRIQLDERNDRYVEDRIRFFNDKMHEINTEQNKQFDKHVDTMEKKISNFYDKLEQDRKNEHNKHILMVNREQTAWKHEVNETQIKLKEYINTTIEENKRENERIWNKQHEQINILIDQTKNTFNKQLKEAINKTKDIVEKEKKMIQTEHTHVKKDLNNQTHMYETKLLEHENKLENNLEETRRMYNILSTYEMQTNEKKKLTIKPTIYHNTIHTHTH